MQRSLEKLGKDAKRSSIPFKESVLYGATSGYALWLAIYPIVDPFIYLLTAKDAVKSLIQTDAFEKSKQKYSGIIDCVQKTYKRSGMVGFYRGFWPCILRAAPCNAATFVAYEAAMNLIAR